MHSSTVLPLLLLMGLSTVVASDLEQSSSAETRDYDARLVIDSDGGRVNSSPVTAVFGKPESTEALSAVPRIPDKVLPRDLNSNADNEGPKARDYDYYRPPGPDPVTESEDDPEDEDEDEEEEDEDKGHNLKKRDLNERIRQHMMEQRAVNYTVCDTCRKMHLDMKQASLDHIKKYVLSFLGFNDSGPPKKPGSWPAIPDYILDRYYADSQPRTTFSPGDDWEEERVNHQSQQRYLDMHGSGAMSGAAPDQDYMADDPSWNLRQAQPQEEEPFKPLVKTNRIYLFPNVTKFRHQQHDLMSFEFPATMSKRRKGHGTKNGDQHNDSPLNPLLYLDVSKALLHISFCNEHVNTALVDELRGHLARGSPFRVTVHRLVAKEHQSGSAGGSEKFSKEEVTVEIPSLLIEALVNAKETHHNSSGHSGNRKCRRRIELDITQVVKDWYKYPKKNHGLLLTTEPVRLKNAVSMKQTDHKPFLELWTETTRKKRVKRDLSMTCKEGDYERRCCMYPLKVDFELFGWDFIIAPKQYEANYCAGECTINFLPSYTHTHMMQLSTTAPACCSPKKMQPLSLLYFNRKEQVIYTKMENMIVETCGCS